MSRVGVKIKLGEVADNVSALQIQCMNHTISGGGCFHRSELDLLAALDRWGEHRRLDELPLRCSACGSREIDVRANAPARPSGAESAAPSALDAWRARPPSRRS